LRIGARRVVAIGMATGVPNAAQSYRKSVIKPYFI